MKQVVIIGGGASGLMAGIAAARGGAAVTILEKCDRPGKKILATGNGRCNLTNRKLDLTCYNGEKKQIERVLNRFTDTDTLDFFHNLGLWTKERDGWVYPRTDQAGSVLQLLLQEFSGLKGKMKTLEEVTEIRKNSGNGSEKAFTVYTKGWHYDADAVIVASGTPASNIEGVSDDALKFANAFRIRSEEFRPSLVPLRCVRENYFAKWAGIRAQAELKLLSGETLIQTEKGELQLTDYGISGIPVFQLSSRAGALLKEEKKPVVEINFFPDQKREELLKQLEELRARYPERRTDQLLTGLVPDKLIQSFCGKKTSIAEAVERLFATKVRIQALGPLKQAQICAGGVLLKELSDTMEAKNVPGLYFVGECCNTDGRCGGYNLQWAWSTGRIAGQAAAGQLEDL